MGEIRFVPRDQRQAVEQGRRGEDRVGQAHLFLSAHEIVPHFTPPRAGAAENERVPFRRASGVPLRLAAGLRCQGRSRVIPNAASKDEPALRPARRRWRAAAWDKS